MRKKVLVMPRDGNPYQSLLYREVSGFGLLVRYLDGPTASQTINLLLLPITLGARRLLGYRILHIHWVYEFALPWAKQSTLARRVMQQWFTLCLCVAHALGYRIVWTAHNVLPHEQVFWDDKAARQVLIHRADAVIAHSAAVADQLVPLGARDVHVIPQGGYQAVYPSTTTRKSARAELGIRSDDFVVTCFGRVLPYKGVDLLLHAATGLETPVRVLVAGECRDGALRERLVALAQSAGSGALLHLERVPDNEVPLYFCAADFAAFPFRRIANSSSVLLALSFGVPVLIPALEELADIPDDCAVRYRPHEGGLAAGLLSATELSPVDLSAMSRRAAAYAALRDWTVTARATCDVYDDIMVHKQLGGGRRTAVTGSGRTPGFP